MLAETVVVKCSARDAKAIHQLFHRFAVGEQRLGSCDIIVGEGSASATVATITACGGQAGHGSLTNNTAFKFGKRCEDVE